MNVLPQMLRAHAKTSPDKPAIRFDGYNVSYSELERSAEAVAGALAASGLNPGDRIAYLGRNHAHYFELLFGAARAGIVLTPINHRLTTPEVAHIVEDSGSRIIFLESSFLSVVAPLLSGREDLQALPIDDESYGHWRKGAGEYRSEFAPSDETITLQLYTSGTTGRPKGVMLTHRNLLYPKAVAAEEAASWNSWNDDDVILVATPLAHIGATGWALWALFHGATAIILGEFSAEGVLGAIATDGVTKLFLVPSALQMVARHPEAAQTDFSALQIIMYGASPMPLATLQECMGVFGCAFAQHYGMTETGGSVAILPPEDHSPAGGGRMLAAGKPIGGAEISIQDDNGTLVATGVVGEIAVRGAAVMAGYWQLPDATRQSIGSDGWLRTGDAGYLDADGYLYIADRLKDMIISGGENVYPTEVEGVIAGHPNVADVAVIGIPDERWGEAVRAIVVPCKADNFSETELRDWCRERLAGFKIPKHIDLISELPRNPSGKTDRRALREPFWEGRARQVN